MASYDESPQDEGYSEDPLTVGTVSGSANMQNWILSLPVAQRTGEVSRDWECPIVMLTLPI
jgi:F-box and WD-40 domain protein 1/11